MIEMVPVSPSPLFSLAGQLGPKVSTLFLIQFNYIPLPHMMYVSVATVVLWCMVHVWRQEDNPEELAGSLLPP